MKVVGVLTLVLALGACAWFALGARQAIKTNQATNLITGQHTLSAADGRRAASLLHDAGILNPDSTVDLLRARLDAARGDRQTASRLALEVTRREPMNIDAWYTLATVAPNERTVSLTFPHIRELLAQPSR